jgi:hypothetical protein
MKNVYNLNRGVAGHRINYLESSFNIESLASSFELQRKNDETVLYIDTAQIIETDRKIKCKVSGWAYSRISTAPAKSIYIAYDGKLISRGKPTRRIDVRIAENLNFDHCGFECDFELPATNQANYELALIIVGENNSRIHHLKVANFTSRQYIENTRAILDASVIRASQSKFEYSIESARLTDGKIQFLGWCYLKDDPGTEVYVSFLRSGVFLTEIECTNISRKDVGASFLLPDSNHFYGFNITSAQLSTLPINKSEQAIDMYFFAPSHNLKEIITIYSK